MKSGMKDKNWISPEAGRKLEKLLQKHKGKWVWVKKIEVCYYFNDKLFHTDEFEGRITGTRTLDKQLSPEEVKQDFN